MPSLLLVGLFELWSGSGLASSFGRAVRLVSYSPLAKIAPSDVRLPAQSRHSSEQDGSVAAGLKSTLGNVQRLLCCLEDVAPCSYDYDSRNDYKN